MKKKRVLTIFLLVLLFWAINLAVGSFIDSGLKKYFGLDKTSEILLIGHSHLMLATDKSTLEKELGINVAKYCREGVGVDVREYMVKHYLSMPTSDSLKVVIYGVDQFMFNPTGLSDGAYTLFYPFMNSLPIDSLVQENASKKDYWYHRAIKLSNYSDALLNSSVRGHLNNWDNYKSGQIDTLQMRQTLSQGYNRTILFEPELKLKFERTMDLLKSGGYHVVLLNTPIVKELNELQPQQYDRFQKYMDSIAASSPLIHYWDLNPELSDKYSLFYDMIHLNNIGQQVATDSIISRFKKEFPEIIHQQ